MRRFNLDPYACAKACVGIALASFLFGVMLPGVLGMWGNSHTMNTLVVTPAMRAEVVTALADQAARHYTSEEKGRALAQLLLASERAGAYRMLTTPQQLARALTADMRMSTGDMHMQVEFRADVLPDVGDRGIDLAPDDDVSPLIWLSNRVGRTMARFGVMDVSQSDAGIGYIRLNRFSRPFLAAEKYAAAMRKVADSRALILDLRDNGGGSAASVALLASYFFDRPTHLSDIELPRTHAREAMWTSASIDGPRYGMTRPVIILTSRETFSGAEDFAYSMQTLQRATVIGEVTGGGAHPTERYRLAPHFLGHIPVARSISPVTGTNWEGVGVQPDVRTPASAALRVATATLLKALPD